jgi:hypothetical protein
MPFLFFLKKKEKLWCSSIQHLILQILILIYVQKSQSTYINENRKGPVYTIVSRLVAIGKSEI